MADIPAEETYTFYRLCEDVFEKVKKNPTRARRNEILSRFWESYHSDNTFPVMRLLTPDLDMKRPAYGIKQDEMAKRYIKALALAPTSEDALQLKNYRKMAGRDGKSTLQGDFISILYNVLQKRVGLKPSTTTIKEINDLLDQLFQAHEKRDPDGKDKVFNVISRTLSPLEQVWVAAIVLKNLKFGVQSMAILKNYHADGEEFYKRSANLEDVCRKLVDPNVRLDSLGMAPFNPAAPMLAKRLERADLEHILGRDGSSFFLETKFDGWRMLVHKKGDQFKLFSRKGIEYTEQFRDLLPYLSKEIKSDSCIVDGELCLWDEDKQRLAPFEELGTYRRLGGKNVEGTWQKDRVADRMSRGKAQAEASPRLYSHRHLVWFAFDVLYHNGQILTEQPLRKRRLILENHVIPGCAEPDPDLPSSATAQRGNVVVAYQKFVTRKTKTVSQQVLHHYDHLRPAMLSKAQNATDSVVYEVLETRAIRGHHEGLLIKDPEAVYSPAARSDKWIKLKPEYYRTEELDCVVLGGCYSEGPRMGGKLTHFLLGVAQPRPPSVGDDAQGSSSSTRPTKFHSFCRVGNFTDQEVASLSRLPWKKYNDFSLRTIPKSWVPFIIRKQDRPDMVVDPGQSVIITVTGYQILQTAVYSCGYTLRFPRKVKVRDPADKPWHECATLHDVQEIFRRGQGAGRMFRADGTPAVGKKKRREKGGADLSVASKAALLHVPAHFRVTSTAHITAKTAIFGGIEFCVRNGVDLKTGGGVSSQTASTKHEPGSGVSTSAGSGTVPTSNYSKDAIAKLIATHGGTLTATPRLGNTSYVVAVRENYSVKGDIKVDFDVVRPEWLYRWVNAGQWVPPRYSEVHHPGVLLRKTFLKAMDMYGDFYAQDSDAEQLHEVFARMGRGETILEEDYYEDDHKDQASSSGPVGPDASVKAKDPRLPVASVRHGTRRRAAAAKRGRGARTGMAKASTRAVSKKPKNETDDADMTASGTQSGVGRRGTKHPRPESSSSSSSDEGEGSHPSAKRPARASTATAATAPSLSPEELVKPGDQAILKFPSTASLPVSRVLGALGDDAFDLESHLTTGLFRSCVVWVDFDQAVVQPEAVGTETDPAASVDDCTALGLGLCPSLPPPDGASAHSLAESESAVTRDGGAVEDDNPAPTIWQSPLLVVPHLIRFHGGRVVAGITPEVTHVVVREDVLQARQDEIFAALVSTAPTPHIHSFVVTGDWVNTCIKERALVPEEQFKP